MPCSPDSAIKLLLCCIHDQRSLAVTVVFPASDLEPCMSYSSLIEEDPVETLRGISADTLRESKENAFAMIRSRVTALQEILLSCEKKIQQWQASHNEINVFAKLPDDVLIEIFLHIENTFGDTEGTYRKPIHLLSITWVCSRWRRVALECPAFWRRPMFHHMDCATEMLKRAKDTPLILSVVNGVGSQTIPSHTIDAVALAFANLSRAEELILVDDFDPWERRFQWEVQDIHAPQFLNAPLLRRLTINASNPHWGSHSRQKLLDKCPSLQSLHTHNWNVFWSFASSLSQFALLISLHVQIDIALSHVHHSEAQQTSVKELIEALNMLPNLRELFLYNVLKQPDDEDLEWYQSSMVSASLPHLTNFCFSANLNSLYSSLWDCILYPETTEVVFYAQWHKFAREVPEPLLRNEIENSRNLLRSVRQRLHGPISILQIIFAEEGDSCSLTMWTTPPELTGPTKPPLCLYLPLRAAHRIIRELPLLLDLQYLQGLMCSFPYSDDATWQTFGLLDNVRILRVSPASPSLLDVLSASQSSEKPEGETSGAVSVREETEANSPPEIAGAPYFPALQSFQMYDWTFSETSIVGQFQYPYLGTTLAKLKECLSKRRNRGVGLIDLQLCLHCAGIGQADIDAIQAFVANKVVWSDEQRLSF